MDRNNHDPFPNERTQEKIDKHLSDINDKISEEDIQNVNTDIKTDTLVANNTEETKKLKQEENDMPEDDKNDIEKGEANEQIPTAFNILGS